MRKHLLVGLWIGWLATAATSAEAPKGMTGRVVDENGQALSGVKVVGVEYRGTGQDSDNKEVASTTTGADGAFHLDTPASVVTNGILRKSSSDAR